MLRLHWMATEQLSDGAIISAPDRITPYLANAAAPWLAAGFDPL